MNTGQKQKTLEVLCCYAREDRSFVDQLTKHLSSLKRQETITIWSDYDIHAGSEWESQIEAHLDMADIILLFVSADFISSDYCYSKEMQYAMERHEQGEARVVPLIIRFCDWKTTPLGKLQALPEDAKPIVSWTNRDKAYLSCVNGIGEITKDVHFVEGLQDKVSQVCASGDAVTHGYEDDINNGLGRLSQNRQYWPVAMTLFDMLVTRVYREKMSLLFVLLGSPMGEDESTVEALLQRASMTTTENAQFLEKYGPSYLPDNELTEILLDMFTELARSSLRNEKMRVLFSWLASPRLATWFDSSQWGEKNLAKVLAKAALNRHELGEFFQKYGEKYITLYPESSTLVNLFDRYAKNSAELRLSILSTWLKCKTQHDMLIRIIKAAHLMSDDKYKYHFEIEIRLKQLSQESQQWAMAMDLFDAFVADTYRAKTSLLFVLLDSPMGENESTVETLLQRACLTANEKVLFLEKYGPYYLPRYKLTEILLDMFTELARSDLRNAKKQVLFSWLDSSHLASWFDSPQTGEEHLTKVLTQAYLNVDELGEFFQKYGEKYITLYPESSTLVNLLDQYAKNGTELRLSILNTWLKCNPQNDLLIRILKAAYLTSTERYIYHSEIEVRLRQLSQDSRRWPIAMDLFDTFVTSTYRERMSLLFVLLDSPIGEDENTVETLLQKLYMTKDEKVQFLENYGPYYLPDVKFRKILLDVFAELAGSDPHKEKMCVLFNWLASPRLATWFDSSQWGEKNLAKVLTQAYLNVDEIGVFFQKYGEKYITLYSGSSTLVDLFDRYANNKTELRLSILNTWLECDLQDDMVIRVLKAAHLTSAEKYNYHSVMEIRLKQLSQDRQRWPIARDLLETLIVDEKTFQENRKRTVSPEFQDFLDIVTPEVFPDLDASKLLKVYQKIVIGTLEPLLPNVETRMPLDYEISAKLLSRSSYQELLINQALTVPNWWATHNKAFSDLCRHSTQFPKLADALVKIAQQVLPTIVVSVKESGGTLSSDEVLLSMLEMMRCAAPPTEEPSVWLTLQNELLKVSAQTQVFLYNHWSVYEKLMKIWEVVFPPSEKNNRLIAPLLLASWENFGNFLALRPPFDWTKAATHFLVYQQPQPSQEQVYHLAQQYHPDMEKLLRQLVQDPQSWSLATDLFQRLVAHTYQQKRSLLFVLLDSPMGKQESTVKKLFQTARLTIQEKAFFLERYGAYYLSKNNLTEDILKMIAELDARKLHQEKMRVLFNWLASPRLVSLFDATERGERNLASLLSWASLNTDQIGEFFQNYGEKCILLYPSSPTLINLFEIYSRSGTELRISFLNTWLQCDLQEALLTRVLEAAHLTSDQKVSFLQYSGDHYLSLYPEAPILASYVQEFLNFLLEARIAIFKPSGTEKFLQFLCNFPLPCVSQELVSDWYSVALFVKQPSLLTQVLPSIGRILRIPEVQPPMRTGLIKELALACVASGSDIKPMGDSVCRALLLPDRVQLLYSISENMRDGMYQQRYKEKLFLSCIDYACDFKEGLPPEYQLEFSVDKFLRTLLQNADQKTRRWLKKQKKRWPVSLPIA